MVRQSHGSAASTASSTADASVNAAISRRVYWVDWVRMRGVSGGVYVRAVYAAVESTPALEEWRWRILRQPLLRVAARTGDMAVRWSRALSRRNADYVRQLRRCRLLASTEEQAGV
jgi:hypothetical protein